MSTPYDDAFKTLLVDHTRLIIPVVNEIFNEHYTGSERIEFLSGEHFLPDDYGAGRKIISDSCFGIYGAELKKYHIECQSTSDGTILVRMFEYDISIAIEDSRIEDGTLVIRLPKSAILQLRISKSAAKRMDIRIEAGEKSVTYSVELVNVQSYSVDEIFSKGLLFFIPFHIFAHESRLAAYDADAEKLSEIVDEYKSITKRLDDMCAAGELDDYTRLSLLRMTAATLDGIAGRYPAVRRGVGDTLGGKVLDYEEKRIYMRGVAEGEALGIAEGEARGRSEALRTAARNMIDCGFSFEQISRVTGLSSSDINAVRTNF